MLKNLKIENSDQLEFAIVSIENIAKELGKTADEVYSNLTKQSDILNSYIIPEYEVLHTQSKEYIVNDIINVMKDRGIKIWFYITDLI